MNHSEPTVLIVEDNPNDILLLERAVEKAKLANPIRIVKDGEAAVRYLDGQPPFEDRRQNPIPILILLDLKLPRKSGLEVLAWIKNEEKLKRIPVIILTTSRLAPDINRAYDLGANSYLIKPVAFDSLVNLVQTLDLYWIVLNEKPLAID